MSTTEDDMLVWLRATIEGDKTDALDLPHGPWHHDGVYPQGISNAEAILIAKTYTDPSWPPHIADHIIRHDPQDTIARCEAELLLLDEHAAYWRTVEWPHDQNGKGEAMCCRSCENADSTEWNPPVGQAGVLPEGFVAKYVVAPCRTMRLLARGYRHRPGWNPDWARAVS